MSFGTITSTESTFGSISGSIVGAVPGTLSGSVGVPGPAGAGVPAGGTAGQYLQKTTTGVDYATDWVTLNLSGYAPLASPAFTGNPTAPTAALGDNDTSLATTAFVQQELLSGTANAKNLEVYVRNQTGSTLSAGAIVYINGATGNRPTVTLAQANNDANSAQTMGFVKTAIANNGFGYVIVRGEIEGLDTQAVAEGTQLYLSPTVAGAYTTTKPSAPQHLVYVGIVIRSHPTQGVILVAVQNGYELNELHDVSITSPTNGQVLKYNSTTGLWYNGTDSAGVAWGGITGTLSNQTDLQTALDGKYSTTNPAGYITSSALTGYATETFVTSQGYITSAALSPYLTSATAASTYQTLSGMSSYLTTSAAASTYLTQANAASTYYLQTNPAGYITSSALSPYLTSATAASTYQTLSGMSSYLTTATAASTYAPIASPTFTGLATFDNPGNYAISVPASGVGYDVRIEGQLFTMRNASAEVIRISPGGIKYPDGVTQSVAYPGPSGFLLKADNLSGLANTGTARTNLGLGTMATETASNYLTTATAASTYQTLSGMSSYLTTATAASTYFTIASAANKADLASPTFTGTPSLPTGTIAVTQSAGNNTTAVATTAFVTAAVPAIATVAQVYASTSGTTATPPLLAPLAFNSGGYFPRMNFASSSSGTGAGVGGADHRFEIIGPNVATAGFAQITSEHQQMWSAGTTFTILQFSKPVWFSFRMCNFSATYDGDAQTEIKAFIGNAVTGGVDPSAPAVGIYKAGGAGSFINLMVHNGTTLTKVATTTTFSTTVIDVAIYSNNGTVNLYLNGVLAATTALGPTGTSNTTRVIAAVKATATAAVRQLLEIANIKVFAPQ